MNISQENKPERGGEKGSGSVFLSVIIPAFNEGYHIYTNLEKTKYVLDRLNLPYELVLVDDGSEDNTLAEAKRFHSKHSSLALRSYSSNNGKGFALKEGFSVARGEIIAFLDADLEFSPDQVERLIHLLEKSHADVAIGSKRHPESKINYPLGRKIISYIYCQLLRILFRLPLYDTQSGLKVFRRKVLEDVLPHVRCMRFAVDLEILAHAHSLGYKVVECPVILNFRRMRKWGRITPKDLILTGWDTLRIYFRLKFSKDSPRHLPRV